MSTIAMDMKPVTKSDVSTITSTKGLFVGTGGDVRVLMANGRDVIIKNLAGGIIHPISVTKVFNTSTTASDVMAVY